MSYQVEEKVACFCEMSSAPEEIEPGAHHSVTCEKYRSSFVGPDKDHWKRKFEELCQIRMDKAALKA